MSCGDLDLLECSMTLLPQRDLISCKVRRSLDFPSHLFCPRVLERNNQDYSRSARTADQALPESSSPRFSYSISRLPNFEHRPSPSWTELLTKSLLNDMLVEHCFQLTSSNETQRPSTRGRRPTPTGPAAAQRRTNYASYPRDGVRKVQHLRTLFQEVSLTSLSGPETLSSSLASSRHLNRSVHLSLRKRANSSFDINADRTTVQPYSP